MLQKLFAVCVLVLLGPIVSAAAQSVGFVSAIGEVQVRGVALAQVATIFCGDRIRTGARSYAAADFLDGSKIEFDSDTELKLGKNCQKKMDLELLSGSIGFRARKDITVSFAKYRLDIQSGGAGNVKFVGQKQVGLRMINGSAAIHNPKLKSDKKNKVVTLKNQERVMDLTTGVVTGPPDSISIVPSPLPLPRKR